MPSEWRIPDDKPPLKEKEKEKEKVSANVAQPNSPAKGAEGQSLRGGPLHR